MDLLDKGGYSLRNLTIINVIMGKNGCGKSRTLRSIERELVDDSDYGLVKYITPERGGTLVYNANTFQNVESSQNWLPDSLRRNQFDRFKSQSIYQYSRLETLVNRNILRTPTLRDDHSLTFQNTIDKINYVLDYIEIRSEGNYFKIYSRETGEEILPHEISSGESELISLCIECLIFNSEVEWAENQDRINCLFLDEPDVHIHPDLQARFALFINDLFQTDSTHLIIATHSTALISALSSSSSVSVSFMQRNDTELDFEIINEIHNRILPIFGAHPLSNIFNDTPILLVEGEDDVRIWQQAYRSSGGRINLNPCSVDTISNLNRYETQVASIINSIYDEPVAYSLRDSDGIQDEELDDISLVVRFRLSCRNAENLLLTDDVLSLLNITWDELTQKIANWIENNTEHIHYSEMLNFVESDYDRKFYDIKELRNDIMGIIGSSKPWEVAVGGAIARETLLTGDNSLKDYLGTKFCENIFL